MCKFLRFAFTSLVIVAVCALGAMAQSTTTGAIGGTVSNPNKEVVPGASVTVKNVGTNREDTAVSDDNGRFRVVNLAPGTYTVTVNAAGFAPFTVERLIVEVGLVTNVDASVTIGPISPNEVVITSEAPVINTSQQDFTSNMNQTSINNLPINGQRWSNFALLTPGTVPDANFGLISFRGISGLLNNNTIDGGDNNQAFFSEEKGRTRLSYTTSPSSIREFQVNTSNYSAEYGRAAGGVVNAVTKSGTNQIHGNAFYYRRDNKWGARNPLGFLSSATGAISAFKPLDVRNRWGITIGGPVIKDKFFWIFTYDEQRRNFPGLGIFSNLTYLSTVNNAQLLGKGMTQPQIDNIKTFLSSLTGPTPRQGNQRIFLPKIDWNVTPNHTFTFSYNYLRWKSPAGIQTQPTNTIARRSFGDDFVNGDTFQFRLASNFGANMVNEARFQYGRDNEFEFSQVPLPGEPLTAPAYPGVTSAGTRGPDVFLTGGIEFGVATFLERTAFPDEKRYQYADTVTLTHGDHTIKFGGDFNHVNDLQDNLRNYAGAYSFSNVNDFMLDYQHWLTPAFVPVCSTTARTAGRCYTSNFNQGFGGTKFAFSTEDINFFVQDDWRYTAHLTVNLGLRYEYERMPKPFLGNSLIPQTLKMPADHNNFGPRMGFAWDMSGDGKNSLRGGYGLYFGRIINSTILNALTNTGRLDGQVQTSTAPASGPIFPQVFPNLAAAGLAGIAVQFFQPKFQAPAINSMDLIYEREVARNTVVSFSFLGSFGRRLPTFLDQNLNSPVTAPFTTTVGPNTFTINPTYTISGGQFGGQTYSVPLFTGARPVTAIGAGTQISSSVSSSYYGFVAQLNRRLTNGLQFQMNYTRSHSTDTGQASVTFSIANNPFNVFNPGGESGNSNFDIPHKFIANAVWSPHFNTSSGANWIVNGWQFAPIFAFYSGAPYTPSISGSFPTTCAAASGCTNTGGVSVSGPTVSTQAGGQNGSGGSTRFNLVGRNTFRLPKIWNVDLRVSKRFSFTESTALEFLVEGFNVFNRTQVTGLNTAIYATGGTYQNPTLTPVANYGTVSAAGGTLFRERQVQVAVRFEF